MNEDELRHVARAAHDETMRTTDSLADLALVHRRIAHGKIGRPVEHAGHRPLVRRARWMLPAAAAVIAIAVAGLIVLGTRDGSDSVRTSDSNVRTSAPAAMPSTIPTAPSSSLTTTTTDVVEPSVPGTVAVDAATPPSLVVPEPLAAIPVAPNPDRNLISVAIGPTSIAVRQPATDVVTLIDYGAGVDAAASMRDVGLDEPLDSIVLGPGDVLYGFGDTVIPASGGMPDAFRYVAVALSGDKTGQVVAESDLSPVRYLELPPGTFGHGPDGVIDRDRDVNTTVIEYVDVDGTPIEWSGPAPTLLTFETDLEDGGRVSVVGSDLVWDLAIAKSSDTGGSYVGPSPPAPTSGGRVIYSDTIGRDLTPDQDFGPSAMPVVAILEPDGSGRWIRLPDDWSVAASDVWGTVLMRTTDDSIELALLDDALRTPDQSSDESPVPTTPGAATSNGIDGWRRLNDLPDTRPGLMVTAAAASEDVVAVAVCDPVAAGLGRVGASSVWWATRQDLVWETAVVPSTDRCLKQIVATPLGFFAAGPGTGLRSDDGRDWREWTIDDDPAAVTFGIHAVFPAPDGSRVSALQLRPAPAEATVARMLTTTDGANWQDVTDESLQEFDSSSLAGVIPGGDGLMAFGAAPGGEFVPTAAVFTSRDGARWRRVTPMSSDYENKSITDIVRVDTGFVAVGGDYFATGLMTAWTSPDGINWSRAPDSSETIDPSTAFMTAERVTSTGGRLWAAGTDFDAARDPDELAALWVSDDGRNWNRVEIDAELDIVPFEIVSVADLTLAAWPPDPRLSDEPLQIYLKAD